MTQLIACSTLMPHIGARPRLAKFLSPYLLLANAEDYLGVGTLEETAQGLHWVLRDGTELDVAAVTHWSSLSRVSLLDRHADGGALRDEDGYPTRWALGMLASWPWTDPGGWLEFAKKLWHFSSMAFSLDHDAQGCTYHVSTFGWSGNEAAIRAMQSNDILWSSLWSASRVGGHYEFRLCNEDDSDADCGTQ